MQLWQLLDSECTQPRATTTKTTAISPASAPSKTEYPNANDTHPPC